MVTLGFADIAQAKAVYKWLGFKRSSPRQDAITFMQAGAVVLGLFGRDVLKKDAKAGSIWAGNGGTAVAMNCPGDAEVDAMMAAAETAGVRSPAEKDFWGCYIDFLAEPDGKAWEVAYNPFWPLDGISRIGLPA